MPRHGGSGGVHHTKKQKGLANRTRKGVGTYAREGKSKDADRYGTPKQR